MAAYGDAILTAVNVTNAFLDKAKVDTRIPAWLRTQVTRIQTKIDASTNISTRECKLLVRAFKQLMMHVARNTVTNQGQ